MLVRSLIKPDKGPFLREHFDAVKGLKYIPPGPEITVADPWNKYACISPQTFVDVLTQGLEETSHLQIVSSDDGGFMLDLTELSGAYSDGRQIDLNGKTIDQGSISVDLRGQGIGRKLFRNYIELGNHLKLHGFNIWAGSKNGAYAWAKLGVPLSETSLAGTHDSIRNNLKRRLDNVRPSLPDNVYEHALGLIQLNDIYDINRIADLDYILSDDTNFSAQFPLGSGAKNTTRVRPIQEYCRKNKLDFTLARYLLNGTGLSYSGYLDFSDEYAMRRIEKYVGGFKTIELVDDVPQQPVVRQEAGMALTA